MSDDATKKVEIESVPYDMGNIAPTLRDDDELLDMVKSLILTISKS